MHNLATLSRYHSYMVQPWCHLSSLKFSDTLPQNLHNHFCAASQHVSQGGTVGIIVSMSIFIYITQREGPQKS